MYSSVPFFLPRSKDSGDQVDANAWVWRFSPMYVFMSNPSSSQVIGVTSGLKQSVSSPPTHLRSRLLYIVFCALGVVSITPKVPWFCVKIKQSIYQIRGMFPPLQQ